MLPLLSTLDVMQFFMQRRLSDLWGWQTNWLATDRHYVFGEIALINVQSNFNLNLSLGGFIPYAFGVSAQFGAHYKWSTFSILYRQLWHQSSLPSDPLLTQDVNDYDNDVAIGLNFPIWRGDFALSVNFIHGHEGLSDQESINYVVPIWQGQNTMLNITLNANRNQSDTTFFVKFAWQFDQNNWRSQVGHESEGQYGNEQASNVSQFNQASSTWQANQNLSVSADINQGSSNGLATIVNYSNKHFQLQLQNAVNRSGHLPWLYSGLYQFNASTISTHIAPFLMRYPKPQAGVTVLVNGGHEGKFTVFQDGRSSQAIKGDEACFMPVKAYGQYGFSLESIGDRLFDIQAKRQQVVLYHGSVQSLVWQASPAFLLMGYFVTPQGHPLSHYKVSSGLYDVETDQAGFAQVESIVGRPLLLEDPAGRTCRVDMPLLGAKDDVVYLEQIICR